MRNVKTEYCAEWPTTHRVISRRDYRLMLAVVRAAHEVRRLSGTQVHRGAMDQLEVALERFNDKQVKKVSRSGRTT
jgi:hypothetical protein